MDRRLWTEVVQLSYVSEVFCGNKHRPESKWRAHIPMPASASRLCVPGFIPEEASVFLSRGASRLVSGSSSTKNDTTY